MASRLQGASRRSPTIARCRSSPKLRAKPSQKLETPASYDDTSDFVKTLVSGLTAIVNAVIPPAATAECVDNKPAITPSDVYDGVRGDFTDRCYLWTGEVSDEIYAESCIFTDPTLSFQGLSTFKRNLASLKPLIDRLLSTKSVELLDCQLDEDESAVTARWRMTGQFRFPWTPLLDLTGRTKFTYDPALGNLVVRYDEQWDISAADALLQLLKPHQNLQPNM